MHILETDVVLEIGSGNNPNPRADVLCDRFITTDHERAGNFHVVIDRPFVVCDGYHLPFADKSFDYVICSHILEHLEYPEKFIEEVRRVGKRGYIEVPSAVSERIFGWNFHRWYIRRGKRKLILMKKTEGERFGGFFHRLIEKNIWFRRYFESHIEDMYVSYEWNHDVPIVVSNAHPRQSIIEALDRQALYFLSNAVPDFSADVSFYLSWLKRRSIRKARKLQRKLFWTLTVLFQRNSVIQYLVAKLICPNCQDSLRLKDNGLQCISCKIFYVFYGAIPIMLVPGERKKGY